MASNEKKNLDGLMTRNFLQRYFLRRCDNIPVERNCTFLFLRNVK